MTKALLVVNSVILSLSLFFLWLSGYNFDQRHLGIAMYFVVVVCLCVVTSALLIDFYGITTKSLLDYRDENETE